MNYIISVFSEFSLARSWMLYAFLSASFLMSGSPVEGKHSYPHITDPEPVNVECGEVIPTGHYFLAESFFENFDYAFRRVAMLRAYGFSDAGLVHTRCQKFDVEKDLYIVYISEPVFDKTALYPIITAAYELAVYNDIKLINTRIVLAEE